MTIRSFSTNDELEQILAEILQQFKIPSKLSFNQKIHSILETVYHQLHEKGIIEKAVVPPCIFRLKHNGKILCHEKGSGLLRELPTINVCNHCKKRLDKAIYLENLREVQQAKIHALQLELNRRLEASGASPVTEKYCPELRRWVTPSVTCKRCKEETPYRYDACQELKTENTQRTQQ